MEDKIWKFVLAGIAVAIGGMFVSMFVGSIFNGMDVGSAANLGIGMYLCVVVVTCTGIIVSKFDKNSEDSHENSEDSHNDN